MMRKMPMIVALLAFAIAQTTHAADYGAWSKKDKTGQWTAVTEEAVKASELPGLVPTDVERFCPTYAALDADDRAVFWTGLISIIARPESNFKPETKFTESFPDSQGNPVISRGLLQISIESANQKRYACGIEDAESLHQPDVNLRCGVRILAAWVKADNVIASWGSKPNRGGARYWSTLRESRKHLPELTGFTKKLAVCRPQ